MNHASAHLALALILTLSACDNDTQGPKGPIDGSRCELVAVASDYLSTSISLLQADGTPCALDVLTSGSRPPGLLTALSGDIVLPSTPSNKNVVYLLDRYPNGVLTELALDPVRVVAQTRLSPGFAGNPQDLLERHSDGPDELLITRLESPPEGNDGSDLLVLDVTRTLVRRVDLSAFADPGLDPMPTRLVQAGTLLWTGLTHMSRGDFAQTGPGRVLGLDPSTLEVVAQLDLPELTNCGQLAAAENSLWVICAGHFRADLVRRRAFGALVRLPLPLTSPPRAATLALTPDFVARATELGPLGFPLAPISDDTAAVALLGDLTTKAPDRLALVHTDGRLEILAETTPFSLSGLLYLPESNLLLAADGDAFEPRLLRFDLSTSPPTPLAPIVVSKTGLPPRHLARIRPPTPPGR